MKISPAANGMIHTAVGILCKNLPFMVSRLRDTTFVWLPSVLSQTVSSLQGILTAARNGFQQHGRLQLPALLQDTAAHDCAPKREAT
jgi:hypothetical protein